MRKLARQLLQLPDYYRVIPCRYKRPLIKNWHHKSYNYAPKELANAIIAQKGIFVLGKGRFKITGIALVGGNRRFVSYGAALYDVTLVNPI